MFLAVNRGDDGARDNKLTRFKRPLRRGKTKLVIRP